MRKRSSSSPTRSRPPNATFARTLMWGNRAYSWNTRPTERSSGGRSTPRARSNQARSPSAMRPSSGDTRPATARSSVVLPAPEGPASAMRLAFDRQLGVEAEVPKLLRDRDLEGIHEVSILVESRIAALRTTSRQPIASATSKSTSSCS